MTPAQAKKVLEGMKLNGYLYQVDSKHLNGNDISADRYTISLDSILFADQLQAIALWMQDPESVVNA